MTLVQFFRDATLDSHTVTIDWDDGGPVQVLELPPSVTSFSDVLHTFAIQQPHGQSFTVHVTVADEADATTAISRMTARRFSTVWK